MLSEKENTFCCLHTNTTDAVVPKKQTLDQGIIPTKPRKPLIVCLADDISNNKVGRPSFSIWEFINYFTISPQ